MNNKTLFDGVVSKYDKYRPNYCNELFEDIITFSKLSKNMNVLEIGCGTGQATRSFLENGCYVNAVELGVELVAYTQAKYKDFDRFSVECCSFEDFETSTESYDLIYSATAFHWIEPRLGYAKLYSLLKSGGALALFWNRPMVSNENNQLFEEIQSIYMKHIPTWKRMSYSLELKYGECLTWMKEYHFEDINSKQYKGKRSFDSDEYIQLLDTYSDHLALDENVRTQLYSDIAGVIRRHNNKIMIDDYIELYLAKKPSLGSLY